MTRTSYPLLLLLALALVGCGSSDDEGPGPGAYGLDTGNEKPPTEERYKRKKGSWGVAFGAESEKLGIILVDLSGHTLYTFDKDRGGPSTCYGSCAKTWPPALTEGKPKAGGAALPAKVGAKKRKDGTVQLTYAGHPLYRYSHDRSAEVNGNGVESFGGEWYAIRPNGEKP